MNEQDRARWRGSCSSGNSQRRSPPAVKRDSEVKVDFQRIELAGAVGSQEGLEVDFKKLKQIKNRMKKTDWLFLNACVGKFLRVLNGLGKDIKSNMKDIRKVNII